MKPIFFIVLMIVSVASFAQMHKCTDNQGQVSYQQEPCAAGAEAGAIGGNVSVSGTTRLFDHVIGQSRAERERIWIDAYHRSDGTLVDGHWRDLPEGLK